MSKIKYYLARLMYGRYGADSLYYALFALYAVLLIINIFAKSYVISALLWLVILYMLFRSMSKNISARQKENRSFLKVWLPLKNRLMLLRKQLREIKTKRYRRCPKCKSNLRLNRKPGKHQVECPKCHHEFKVTILF